MTLIIPLRQNRVRDNDYAWIFFQIFSVVFSMMYFFNNFFHRFSDFTTLDSTMEAYGGRWRRCSQGNPNKSSRCGLFQGTPTYAYESRGPLSSCIDACSMRFNKITKGKSLPQTAGVGWYPTRRPLLETYGFIAGTSELLRRK